MMFWSDADATGIRPSQGFLDTRMTARMSGRITVDFMLCVTDQLVIQDPEKQVLLNCLMDDLGATSHKIRLNHFQACVAIRNQEKDAVEVSKFPAVTKTPSDVNRFGSGP
jgi:hypothetical protein